MRTRQQFDEDIRALEARFHAMCEITREMLDAAIEALLSSRTELARGVIDQDDSVDSDNFWIENECMRLVIQQQPVAHDLRVIGMIFKAVTDVERIADHAVDLAKLALTIGDIGSCSQLQELAPLAAEVRTMYARSLQAFRAYDTALASAIIEEDNVVDALFHAHRDNLLRWMQADQANSVLASNLVFAAQFLERIGDRCVNMAERIHLIEWGLQQDRPQSVPD
jgi:phosphate transport system protein